MLVVVEMFVNYDMYSMYYHCLCAVIMMMMMMMMMIFICELKQSCWHLTEAPLTLAGPSPGEPTKEELGLEHVVPTGIPKGTRKLI